MTAAPPGPVIIGLDVGTTAAKAIAFSPGSPWRTSAIREYPLLNPGPEQKVQNPAVVLAASAAALAECVSRLGGAEVLAVSLSAAMHALMALDGAGRPITPLVTWADGRAGAEAVALLRSGRAADLQGSTGTPVHPMAPLAKLLWFSHHDPGTWAAARWWVGLKDYLVMWLTGTVATEVSSASGTGLLDVTTRSWDRAALEVCGLEESRLPQILATTTVLELSSRAAASVGLPEGTPVVVGAADGPLANLGVGAIDPGVAALSLGTSGAVRITVDGPHPDRDGTLFCYALSDPLWVVGAAMSNGAEVLRWAGRALAPEVSAQVDLDGTALELAAAVAPGSDGLVMLPFLLPERAPLWNPDLAGAYLGLRHEHSRGHLLRASMEGVCLQMRLILDRLDEVYPVSSVRATGGAFRSPLWRDLMAAAIDRPLYMVGEAEGTALGAATLGMVALGQAATLHDALSSLSPSDEHDIAPLDVPDAPAAAFRQLRRRISELLGALDRVVFPDTLSTDAEARP